MAFDGRRYGMTNGIPFIKVADCVEVNVDLKPSELAAPHGSSSNRSKATRLGFAARHVKFVRLDRRMTPNAEVDGLSGDGHLGIDTGNLTLGF